MIDMVKLSVSNAITQWIFLTGLLCLLTRGLSAGACPTGRVYLGNLNTSHARHLAYTGVYTLQPGQEHLGSGVYKHLTRHLHIFSARTELESHWVIAPNVTSNLSDVTIRLTSSSSEPMSTAETKWQLKENGIWVTVPKLRTLCVSPTFGPCTSGRINVTGVPVTSRAQGRFMGTYVLQNISQSLRPMYVKDGGTEVLFHGDNHGLWVFSKSRGSRSIDMFTKDGAFLPEFILEEWAYFNGFGLRSTKLRITCLAEVRMDSGAVAAASRGGVICPPVSKTQQQHNSASPNDSSEGRTTLSLGNSYTTEIPDPSLHDGTLTEPTDNVNMHDGNINNTKSITHDSLNTTANEDLHDQNDSSSETVTLDSLNTISNAGMHDQNESSTDSITEDSLNISATVDKHDQNDSSAHSVTLDSHNTTANVDKHDQNDSSAHSVTLDSHNTTANVDKHDQNDSSTQSITQDSRNTIVNVNMYDQNDSSTESVTQDSLNITANVGMQDQNDSSIQNVTQDTLNTTENTDNDSGIISEDELNDLKDNASVETTPVTEQQSLSGDSTTRSSIKTENTIMLGDEMLVENVTKLEHGDNKSIPNIIYPKVEDTLLQSNTSSMVTHVHVSNRENILTNTSDNNGTEEGNLLIKDTIAVQGNESSSALNVTEYLSMANETSVTTRDHFQGPVTQETIENVTEKSILETPSTNNTSFNDSETSADDSSIRNSSLLEILKAAEWNSENRKNMSEYQIGYTNMTASDPEPAPERSRQGSPGVDCLQTTFCENGGKLVLTGTSDDPTGECTCPAGFYGVRCEKEIQCGPAPVVAMATLDQVIQDGLLTMAIYRCNPGYRSNSDQVAVCGMDARWLYVPVCHSPVYSGYDWSEVSP